MIVFFLNDRQGSRTGMGSGEQLVSRSRKELETEGVQRGD